MSSSQAQVLPIRPLPARYDGRSPQYQHWRQARLTLQKIPLQPSVGLTQDLATSDDHRAVATIKDQVQTHGFARYHWLSCLVSAQRTGVNLMARRLGLDRSDGGIISHTDQLSLLEDLSGSARGRFVPYSNRAMNWHTDGYYNEADKAVRCFTLHCLQAAAEGGVLTVMDPELLLIALYDEDPQLVSDLSHNNAMLLPSNVDAEGHNRADRQVPVIYAHQDGELGLRFTTRTQHIQWRSLATQAAAKRALELVELNTQWHTQLRLLPGEGIVSRNVLHKRTAFENALDLPQRQMLRGRYLDIPSIQKSGANHVACQ